VNDTKKYPIVVLLFIILFVAFVGYSIYLSSKIKTANERADHFEKLTKEWTTVQISPALKANNDFIDKFFNYQSSNERYKNVQDMVTPGGMRSLFPSGVPNAEDSAAITSKIAELKAYEYQKSNKISEFINEFNVTIATNGVENTQTVLARTTVEQSKDQGTWLITDFEFIGNLTGRDLQ
jgi:Ca2+/Na+ antiporter